MAYETSNPPELLVGIQSYRIWVYKDADAASAVRASGYFTNGWALGMRIGDEVRLVHPTTGATHIFFVNAGSASADIDLSDGTAITATDTD